MKVIMNNSKSDAERAAFVEWLSTTYRRAYSRRDAEYMWDIGHVAALAWQAARRAPSAAQVPLSDELHEGWQMVPVEPTQEMIKAGRNYTTLAAGAYYAMLEAAPQPPAAHKEPTP